MSLCLVPNIPLVEADLDLTGADVEEGPFDIRQVYERLTNIDKILGGLYVRIRRVPD